MKEKQVTTFLQEIDEQPVSLQKLVNYYSGAGNARLREWARRAQDAGHVLFAGMGTSEFAPQMILSDLAESGVSASTMDAGEMLHYPRPFSGLLVLISQSGESIETRKVAEANQGRGPVAILVNNEESTMARVADLVLPMHAGHETAISTKTYVNTLGLLYLMAQAVRGEQALTVALDELDRLAGKMAEYENDRIERGARLVADTGSIHFIARGPTMVAAKQAALTFMEGTRSSCTAFTGGAFRHGPFELVDASHRAVFFIPAGATADLLAAMAVETAEMGSHVVVITNTDITENKCCVIKVPECEEMLFPLAAATVQELLLEAVARARGVVAGVFRHGSKITARE